MFRIKSWFDGSTEWYKAVLFACGFTQLPGLDYDETFNLIVKPNNIRLILMLCLSQG